MKLKINFPIIHLVQFQLSSPKFPKPKLMLFQAILGVENNKEENLSYFPTRIMSVPLENIYLIWTDCLLTPRCEHTR